MAFIRCDFFSEVLGLSTSMTVILPQRTSMQIGAACKPIQDRSGMAGAGRDGAAPTLYLLHGLSDDSTTWLRRTSIERYVAPLGLAVVMPQVDRSFYRDERYGNRYWTFLSEELPAVAGSFFRLSDRREDTFVAGLSMGGYGAFTWALRQPDRFAAAASLSGALDLPARMQELEVLRRQLFGDQPVAGTDADLRCLLDRVDPESLPALYLCCGTEDGLYDDSVAFRDACRDRGVRLTAEFGPGDHEWDYWDAKIQDVLAWLPIPPPAGSGR